MVKFVTGLSINIGLLIPTVMLYLLIFFICLIILFLAGPRISIETHIRPVDLPQDLAAYLAAAEAQIPDLRPNTEKTIIWANPERKNKTAQAIIYLHGFSATRQETAPLADTVAQTLGANLFYTRLTGHGRHGQALAEATVNDWLNDTSEALTIGRRLGEQVIVIGVSTGGALATWLAAHPHSTDISALVLLSPNFALQDRKSEFLLWPWSKLIVSLIGQSTRSREPLNHQDGQYWTITYPTVALFPLMGLTKLVRTIDLGQIKQPLFIAYSPHDTVVNPDKIKKIYHQFGSDKKQLVPVTETDDPYHHVIAGDIRSPSNTEALAEQILAFLRVL